MTGLLYGVFVASVIGSLHCAGMCGPFIAFYAAADQKRGSVHVAYHLGRLATYVTLGAVAGGVGQAANGAFDWVGLGRIGSWVASGVMVVWGGLLLAEARGVKLFRSSGGSRWVFRLASRAQGKPPLLRGALLGASSGLLPCGWLYAFVVTAAGTGDPVWGALTLLTFWAGTVPALVLFAWGLGRLSAPVRRWVPTLSAVALVALGILGAFTRVSSAVPGTGAKGGSSPSGPTMPANCPMHRGHR